MTRVLGVDTALRCTGYGVIETDGRVFRAIDCGVIRNKPKAPVSECLRCLGGGMREIVGAFAPDVAAIEGTFYFRNARTAMVLGMARGAVVSTLASMQIPQYEYAPKRVKQAVCGHGSASKQQVATLVAQILGISVTAVPDDATDALALAICHAQTAVSFKGIYLPELL